MTGANSGLGLITARELARAGAKTILAVRNTVKGDEAAATITGDVEVRESTCRTSRRCAPSQTGSTPSTC